MSTRHKGRRQPVRERDHSLVRAKQEAVALLQQARIEEALPCWQALVAAWPGDWECWANLACAQKCRGDWADALQSYLRAAAINPGNDLLCIELARLYRNTSQLRLALDWFYKALQARPDSEAHFLEWATTLLLLGYQPDALKCLADAWREEPDNPRFAVATLQAAASLAEWDLAEQAEAMLLARVQQGYFDELPLFAMLALKGFDRRLQRHFAEGRVRDFGLEAQPRMPLAAPRSTDKRPLRIGYLSADFLENAAARLLNGVLLAHATAGLEAYLYSCGPDDGSIRRKELEQGVTCFRDMQMNAPAQIAQAIVADEIDILVDLKGWTKDCRPEVLAMRPAPLLVNWLGYPGTIGTPLLADYILGDATVTPLAHADGYCELIAQMPHTYLPTDNRRPLPAPCTRTQLGLPAEGRVFAAFNRIEKLTREMFAAWCRILAAVPGSVLWLWCDLPQAADRLRRAAASHGIVAERLIFAPLLPLEQHVARLQCADLALDTFPYNSHTTGSDILWAGLPLLAMQGDSFASRVSASLVRAAGLPDMVVTSLDDYVDKAVALAHAPATLLAMRHHLEAGRTALPLFATEAFTRDLAQLYQRMWQDRQQGIRQHLSALAS